MTDPNPTAEQADELPMRQRIDEQWPKMARWMSFEQRWLIRSAVLAELRKGELVPDNLLKAAQRKGRKPAFVPSFVWVIILRAIVQLILSRWLEVHGR